MTFSWELDLDMHLQQGVRNESWALGGRQDYINRSR